MDDLPSLQEVLGNVQPDHPPILPPTFNIDAAQLASLIESAVASALARREALITSSSSLVYIILRVGPYLFVIFNGPCD